MTIGGNDLGFYNILTSCVLWVGGPLAGDCDKYVQKAYNALQGRDLYDNIQEAMKQIIDKSGQPTFMIYFSGYPSFFNTDTDWCDDTSFRLWYPHHRDTPLEWGEPWLSKALRVRLNNLVRDLNTFLSQIVDSVNSYYRTQRVKFIDPNPAFNGYRWCEQEGGQDVHEPKMDRMETWFFLSAWPDNNLPENMMGAETALMQELSEQEAGNTTALPDPTTCKQELDAVNNQDWAGK